MTLSDFIAKGCIVVRRKISFSIFQYPKVIKLKILSNCQNVKGSPVIIQPVQMNGRGEIEFEKNVHLGVDPSPYLYSGYIYIEARDENSKVHFCEGVWVNNNCSFISEGRGIIIGCNTLIGASCEIIDSDFHSVNLGQNGRRSEGKKSPIVIGNDVFIGSNVKILKGVTIGDNSVIGNGAIVTKSIPNNVIAAGIPAKIIRSL